MFGFGVMEIMILLALGTVCLGSLAAVAAIVYFVAKANKR